MVEARGRFLPETNQGCLVSFGKPTFRSIINYSRQFNITVRNRKSLDSCVWLLPYSTFCENKSHTHTQDFYSVGHPVWVGQVRGGVTHMEQDRCYRRGPVSYTHLDVYKRQQVLYCEWHTFFITLSSSYK